MGLFDFLKSAMSTASEQAASMTPPEAVPPAGGPVVVPPRDGRWVGKGWPDMETSGESYRRREIQRFFHSLGRTGGGVTNQIAELVPEPTNRHDRNAVKVVVGGEHVAYVPAEDAPRVRREIAKLPKKARAIAPARIWADNEDGTWRARVTLTFSGHVATERDFAAERAERRAAEAAAEAARRVGQVRGQWWTAHRAAIGELKKQERYTEALALIEECAAAVLRVAAVEDKAPSTWPAEQASVVLRRLKDPVREVQILEAYVLGCGQHPVPDRMVERLNRARIAAQGAQA